MREDNPFILLVEDDSLLADITAFRLELLGFEVQSFETAEEAWEFCEEYEVDMVIVDLELADNKALGLIEKLQAGVDTRDTPILVFADDPSHEVVQKAFQAGARDYLMTPYDTAVLEHKIERLLSPETVA